ncbi:hypothetical protein HN803_00555 [candidate division WWE3 bacterium]|nr:hypothetical protein [candidate division WWE3 bacterium]
MRTYEGKYKHKAIPVGSAILNSKSSKGFATPVESKANDIQTVLKLAGISSEEIKTMLTA